MRVPVFARAGACARRCVSAPHITGVLRHRNGIGDHDDCHYLPDTWPSVHRTQLSAVCVARPLAHTGLSAFCDASIFVCISVCLSVCLSLSVPIYLLCHCLSVSVSLFLSLSFSLSVPMCCFCLSVSVFVYM